MFSRFALIFFLFAGQAYAHEKTSIQNMSELQALERSLGDAPATLFVFDIDNTLLRTKQDLGGDAWFTWQENLFKNSPQHPDLVAPEFAGLITVQGWLFQLSRMITPEADTPHIFREMQTQGHPVILLTSRGLDFENLTQRELTANGYDSGATALQPRDGLPAPFVPYDIGVPAKSCLTDEDVKLLGLPPARPILYRKGVVLTGGQHKGAILRTLLCNLGLSFPAIVFVDDHQKHVDRVFQAYENQPGDLRSVKYNFMDEEVKAFHDGDKAEVRAQWARLKEVIGDIF